MVKPQRCLQKLKVGVTLESQDEKAHLSAAKHRLGVTDFFPPLIVSFKHIITVLPDNCKGA